MAEHCGTNPEEPHEAGDHTVCNFSFRCITTQHQTQATVDNSQSDKDATPPDMNDRPDCTLVLFLVDGVVKQSKGSLDKKSTDDNYADNRVAVAGCYL